VRWFALPQSVTPVYAGISECVQRLVDGAFAFLDF
jgi:hypothetical protein